MSQEVSPIIGTGNVRQILHIDTQSHPMPMVSILPSLTAGKSLDGNTDIWFDRTTPDATDGDASYTLTNDDEDELLRAQVTYVDGNGLTEIISSELFLVRPAFIVPEIYQASPHALTILPYRPEAYSSIADLQRQHR